MNTALYTWAVDGSGVALRCAVTVLDETRGEHLVLVEFTEHIPFFDKYGSNEPADVGHRRYVDRRSLTAEGSYAPLASFNWLD